jgi:hypothetical protein
VRATIGLWLLACTSRRSRQPAPLEFAGHAMLGGPEELRES